MNRRLTLLGTGTCQLEPNRMASSVLVELGDLRLLYDCGRGIANRLAEVGLRSDDLEHIVISHFHPDHLSDLIPFLHAAARSRKDPRTKDLHIYGPRGTQVQIMRLLSLFGHEDLSRDHDYAVHIHEVLEGPLVVAGRSFEFAHLPPAGNHGIKFQLGNKTVAITGDSHFHDEEIAFLRGADIAIFDSGHLTEDQIIELAVASQPKDMICSHLYQELDAARLAERARIRGFEGTLRVGFDLMKIDL